MDVKSNTRYVEKEVHEVFQEWILEEWCQALPTVEIYLEEHAVVEAIDPPLISATVLSKPWKPTLVQSTLQDVNDTL